MPPVQPVQEEVCAKGRQQERDHRHQVQGGQQSVHMGFVHRPLADLEGKTGLTLPEFLELTIPTAVGGHEGRQGDDPVYAGGVQAGGHHGGD